MDAYKTAVILLVEDDLGDQKLTKQSLKGDKIGNELRMVSTAEEAFEYLEKGKRNEPECPLPDLILLDLNMPGMGGKDFLKQLKTDPDLDSIPVVILTTSDSDKDVLESFQLQASGYIQKPANLEGFRQAMNDLTDYWFVICRRVQQGSSIVRSVAS